MKKHLLATTAAITMVGGAASAQDWNVTVGGYFTQTISHVNIGGDVDDAVGVDFDGIKLHTNAEIHFKPSITLDNGMTFGAVVEYEALNGGGGADGIDESYMFISSDTMGRVEVGHENSAGYKLSVGAPGVGHMGINSPSISMYMPAAAFGGLDTGLLTDAGTDLEDAVELGLPYSRQAFGSSATEVAGSNDAARISYYTPSFNGLTLGVSYAPNGNGAVENNGVFNTKAARALTDVFDIGVNYSQSMGTTDVTLSARYGQGSRNAGVAFGADGGTLFGLALADIGPAGAVDGTIAAGDPSTWALGAQVSTGAFTFGASYAENDNDFDIVNRTDNSVISHGDNSGWSLGMTYDVAGPWTVGFDTYQGEYEIAKTAGFEATVEQQAYRIGASRSLGAGTSWSVYALQVENKFKATGERTENAKSFVIGTGIGLSF